MNKKNIKIAKILFLILQIGLFGMMAIHLINEFYDSHTYETRLIILNNTNTGEIDGKVIDYTCDNNVYVSWFTISKHWFYASTWRDGKIPHSYGECFVKIRRKNK